LAAKRVADFSAQVLSYNSKLHSKEVRVT
jgi:hypothetical protein